MNDYSPEQYALIEGTSDTGYELVETEDGWWVTLAATGEKLRGPRTLEQAFDDVERYSRLTAGLNDHKKEEREMREPIAYVVPDEGYLCPACVDDAAFKSELGRVFDDDPDADSPASECSECGAPVPAGHYVVGLRHNP